MGEEQALEAVDFAYLSGYAGGDETLVREVLSVFRAEACEWSGRIRQAAPGWLTLIHTMKGTARTIGAHRLGVLCERAEAQGEAALPAVDAELERVVAEISDWLAR